MSNLLLKIWTNSVSKNVPEFIDGTLRALYPGKKYNDRNRFIIEISWLICQNEIKLYNFMGCHQHYVVITLAVILLKLDLFTQSIKGIPLTTQSGMKTVVEFHSLEGEIQLIKPWPFANIQLLQTKTAERTIYVAK